MIALDAFAGPGGWSLACKRLGIEEVGIEIDSAARETRAAAGFVTHHIDDVTQYHLTTPFDGLIASPPCQSFSAAGKRKGLEDPRGQLVYEVLRLVPLVRPKWIACEQVPAVLPIWQEFAGVLEGRWGYSAWAGILHAEQYGVPQTRKRAILMASLDKIVAPPKPTHSRYHPRSPERLDEDVKPWVSMAEALGWGMVARPSPTITGGGTDTGGAEPIAHLSRYLMGNVRATNGTIRSAETPAPTITASMDNGNFRWLDSPDHWGYRRPATTVVGSFKPEIVRGPGYRKAGDGPCQNAPGGVRVTVEEAGVLQSFPRDFPWRGTKTKQYQQVGNAIPPLLADAILRELIAT